MPRKVKVNWISRVLAKIQQINLAIERKNYGELVSIIRNHVKDVKKFTSEAKDYYIDLAVSRIKKMKIQALLDGHEEYFNDLSELEEYLEGLRRKL